MDNIIQEKIDRRCAEMKYTFLGFVYGYYLNAKSKFKLRCNIDRHEWTVCYNNFMNGTGCPKCGKTLKIEEPEAIKCIIKKCKQKNYTFTGFFDTFKNIESKLVIICNKDGYIWNPTYKAFINNNSGCPKCAGRPVITTEAALHNITNVSVVKNYTFVKFENGSYKNIRTRVVVRCNKCQREWNVSYDKLVHKKTGCPDCIESAGESVIKEYLSLNGISFIRQKRFADCKNRRALPFDFYLPEHNACIEYDGEQHFVGGERWHGKDNLIYTQCNDAIKTEYCRKNKINLLRISYKDNILSKLINAISSWSRSGG